MENKIKFQRYVDCSEDEISDLSILGLLHRKALKAKSLEDFRQTVDLMID